MPTLATDVLHGTRTGRNDYGYRFTTKHHGGDRTAAPWLPSLSLDEEFAIFNEADEHGLADEDGNLYGLRHDNEGDVLYLGTWNQQVAEFPHAREGEAWHGYPHYPLIELGPANRRGQRGRPARVVFALMVQAGLISERQRRRLLKGDHANER
jgi:hypothetical protein